MARAVARAGVCDGMRGIDDGESPEEGDFSLPRPCVIVGLEFGLDHIGSPADDGHVLFGIISVFEMSCAEGDTAATLDIEGVTAAILMLELCDVLHSHFERFISATGIANGHSVALGHHEGDGDVGCRIIRVQERVDQIVAIWSGFNAERFKHSLCGTHTWYLLFCYFHLHTQGGCELASHF